MSNTTALPKVIDVPDLLANFEVVDRAAEIGSAALTSDERDRFVPIASVARWYVSDTDQRVAKLAPYQIAQRIYERPAEFIAELRQAVAA